MFVQVAFFGFLALCAAGVLAFGGYRLGRYAQRCGPIDYYRWERYADEFAWRSAFSTVTNFASVIWMMVFASILCAAGYVYRPLILQGSAAALLFGAGFCYGWFKLPSGWRTRLC
jgi:hypothetical protein